jgi:hypothetical protein
MKTKNSMMVNDGNGIGCLFSEIEHMTVAQDTEAFICPLQNLMFQYA